jgi:hypothetical protein
MTSSAALSRLCRLPWWGTFKMSTTNSVDLPSDGQSAELRGEDGVGIAS